MTEMINMKESADAIFVSDLHLTETTPVSRIDNYIEAQISKLQFLRELSTKNHNCPILCAGDVFDHWKGSPWLCHMAYNNLPRPFYSIVGQHDLPNHSLENYHRSALALLDRVDPDICVLNGTKIETETLFIVGLPFGHIPDSPDELPTPATLRSRQKRKILLLHGLTFERELPHWSHGDGAYTADELLDTFGDVFDVIVIGDNHQPFVVKRANTILLNPGSMMRSTLDQHQYQPACYLYYAINNEITRVPFPIQPDVHSDAHVQSKQERDKRIAAYIERINQDWDSGLSFEQNLEAFFKANKTPKSVRGLIWQSLGKSDSN